MAVGGARMWSLDMLMRLRFECIYASAAFASLQTPPQHTDTDTGGQHTDDTLPPPTRLMVVAPARAVLMAAVVECPALWRRKQPVGLVEGFDLSAFNEHAAPPLVSEVVDFDFEVWAPALKYLSQPAPLAQLKFGAVGDAGVDDCTTTMEEVFETTLDVVCDGACCS